jgi:excisionase family DNA binding protein
LEISLFFSPRSTFVPYGTLCAHPASLANINALLIAGRENKMDEILTANEAAALLKVHKRTVYRLAEQGIIPGNSIGHRWRFNRTNILALVSKTDSTGSLEQSASRASSHGVLE